MSLDAAALRRARRALTVSFAGNGFMSGALVARLADVKSTLHLTNAGLGTALVLCSIASFLSMAPVSRLVSRVGSGPATMIGVTAYALTFPLLGVLTSVHFLWFALVIYGVALTIHEVAMNSHAVALEHVYRRRIMTVQHATWSAGQLVGVAIGGVLSQYKVPIFWHLAVAALLVLGVAWSVSSWLLPASIDRHDPLATIEAPRSRFSLRHLPFFFVALGLLGFFETIGEGAAGNWGVVLARDSFHAAPLLSTMPYVVYAIVMVLGRLSGDRLATRFSTRNILAASGGFIAVGLGVGMAMDSLAGEFLAWVFLAAGCSNVVPLLFSAAGRAARTRPSSRVRPAGALALVTAIAYSGSLVGPPVIGYLADVVTLRAALLLPAALGVLLVVGVFVVLRHDDDVADLSVAPR